MQNESFSSCVLLPEELQAGAHHFNRRATQVRRKMCWQNCRMNCIIAFVILGILAVITIIVLGQHAYFNFVLKKKVPFLTQWFTLYTCYNFKIVAVWGNFCVTCDIVIILSMSMIFKKSLKIFTFSINLLFWWLRLIWIRFRCLCHRWQNKRKSKKENKLKECDKYLQGKWWLKTLFVYWSE